MYALGQSPVDAAVMTACAHYATLTALAWAFLLEPWLTRTLAQNLALTPHYDAPPPVADEDTLSLEVSIWLTAVCYLGALGLSLWHCQAPLRKSALALTLAFSLGLNGLAPQPAPAGILHYVELLFTPVVPVAHTTFAPRLAWLHALLSVQLTEVRGVYRVAALLVGTWFYATLLGLRRITPSALVLSVLWAYWLRARAFRHGLVRLDMSVVRPAAAELQELASPKAAARTHTINSDDERDADEDDHFEEDSLQTARAVAHAAADAADVHFDAYAAPLRPAADAPPSDA